MSTILEDAAKKKGIKPLTLLERIAFKANFLSFPCIARGWMTVYQQTGELPDVVVDGCLDILVPNKARKEVKLLSAST